MEDKMLRELNHNNVNRVTGYCPPPGRPSGGIISPPSQDFVLHPLTEREISEPTFVGKYAQEIIDCLREREALMVRDANYMAQQTEVTERMRMILIDWMVDVHLKFKLHPETFYLAVDLVDRYLMVQRGQRATLQLVGVCSILLAAKHEEIWPPEVKDCVYICANTYSRDDVLRMERGITEALNFRLTVPTIYPFANRLLEVADAAPFVRSLTAMFMECSALEYSLLQFLPSTVASATVLLALVTNARHCGLDSSAEALWTPWLHQHSQLSVLDLLPCASQLLNLARASMQPNSRYQATKRKYLQTRFQEVSKVELPDSVC